MKIAAFSGGYGEDFKKGISVRKFVFAAVLAVVPFAAQADVILNTTLPILSGTAGDGIVTTTTTVPSPSTVPPYGTVTTVTGSGGPSNQASAPVVTGAWSQQNVGGNGSVGITTQYADRTGGNGSAYFKGHGGSSADLEIRFDRGYTLLSLNAALYEWFPGNDAPNTDPHPVMRFMLATTDGTSRGYLVYDEPYSGPLDNGWAAVDIAGMNARATDPSLIGYGSRIITDYAGGSDTWAGITAELELLVVGVSIGIDPTWTEPFEGAVDNVFVSFGAPSRFAAGAAIDNPFYEASWNFEVAVPEPSALAALGVGLVALGAWRRRAAI